jgi:hypothetical protein
MFDSFCLNKVASWSTWRFFGALGPLERPLSPSFSRRIARAAKRQTVSSPATRDETYGKESHEIVPALGRTFVGSTPSGLGGRVGFAIRRFKPAATHGWPLPGPITVPSILPFSTRF